MSFRANAKRSGTNNADNNDRPNSRNKRKRRAQSDIKPADTARPKRTSVGSQVDVAVRIGQRDARRVARPEDRWHVPVLERLAPAQVATVITAAPGEAIAKYPQSHNRSTPGPRHSTQTNPKRNANASPPSGRREAGQARALDNAKAGLPHMYGGYMPTLGSLYSRAGAARRQKPTR
jgi:hypothetical protein